MLLLKNVERDKITILIHYLFTYGYLKSKYQDIKKAPDFNASSIGQAIFSGLLFEVDDYPGAIFTGKKEEKVFGEVLRIHNLNDLIMLDNYERALPTIKEHPEYERRIRSVVLAKGDLIDCWVYEYILDTTNLRKITSGNY